MVYARHRQTDGDRSAPAPDTFAYLSAHAHVPDWMLGVTTFIPAGEVTGGVGDRFEAQMKLGPKALHSILVAVEWIDEKLFALASVAGVDTTSRWRVSSTEDTHCIVDVEFGYEFAGELTGRTMAKVVEPFIQQAI